MALRAKRPEAVQKRLKLFLYSAAGVGKTTASTQFSNSYIIDAERGTENYEKLINASGSVVFQTTDMGEVITEVKSLLTATHQYRTLVIDPITTLYNDLLDKCEMKVGSDFGRHYGAANKEMKRLANLIMALDMNVVVTAHAKKEFGPKLEVIGQTFDGWKQLDYLFDLVIELVKHGKGQNAKRVGIVRKTRIETFPDGAEFPWSYEEIRKRYDAATLEREARSMELATPEQVKEIKNLLEVVRLPEGMVEKWFSKASVEEWDDMPRDVMEKCLEYVKNRLPQTTAA